MSLTIVANYLRWRCLLTFLVASSAMTSIGLAQTDDASPQKQPAWEALFDGKSLENWQRTNYGGEGQVAVKNGVLALGFGSPLTGVTWTGDPLPKSNYEIELEGRRVMGIDFFCAMTFPVQENTCSFVVGGWAGSIVGLSNIDDEDASENDTTKYMSFKKNQWYKLRVRVTDKAITCWIDDKQVVQQPLKDRRISIRPEVELNKPLGFCSFETESELRNLRIRRLTKAEQDK